MSTPSPFLYLPVFTSYLISTEYVNLLGYAKAKPVARPRGIYVCTLLLSSMQLHTNSPCSCRQCSKPLTPSDYATIDDRFYCLVHYERLYMEKGGYSAL